MDRLLLRPPPLVSLTGGLAVEAEAAIRQGPEALEEAVESMAAVAVEEALAQVAEVRGVRARMELFS